MPTQKHQRIIGDTLKPLNAVMFFNSAPLDLSLYTVKFELEEDDGTAVLEATATGVTKHPTQTFTADATTDRITCVDHGFQVGDQVVVASSTTLPGGLAASTRYFVTDVSPNAFKLESVPGGGAIDITSAGSGTHTIYVVGSVQYDFATATVDEAGLFRGWFTALDGSSEVATFPDDEYGIPIEIKPKGN